MDRIPSSPMNRTKEFDQRARLLDIQQRARAAAPVGTAADILRAPLGAGTDKL